MGKPDTSPVPKKDEMGMDYIPVYENEVADVVTIAPEIVQNMGVRTAPVEMIVFGRTVRAFGAVAENTRLQSVIAVRAEGWIEDLAVDAVGDAVKEGELIFRLYSPDLIAAQQDYLAALASGSAGRAASSARRLRSLGVQTQTIETLRKTRKVMDRIPILATHGGIVSRLEVREGAFVKPGATILAVQDYSSVWVTAAAAEKDLALLAPGVAARLEFPSLPGRAFTGSVDFIHPTVDPQSRTGRVRLVLENPQGALRPGAYADVIFDVEAQRRLAVRSEAILRDSQGAYVVRALGDGRFRPQRIEAGIVSEGYTEVLSGLNEGDEIVVSGQFLIDSESALRESLQKLRGKGTPDRPGTDHEHH
jgi:Cu(I)/Ag(I) efflux system membrane fusion protein